MKRLFSWKIVGSYTFLVVFLSLFPFKEGPQVHICFLDKIVHFMMYMLLSFLVVNTSFLRNRRNVKAFGFFYAFSLGLILEFIQAFLPYRSFEGLDIICNFLGSFGGVFLGVVNNKMAQRRLF
ncbi:MAG: VanZ family protein [Candidatus Omnitrophota bacterium]|nr:MAG: VanZ family protein [Candidatus Omnitrophota bacterium]